MAIQVTMDCFLGWICKVQIADTNELDDLMNEDEYETFCQEEA